MILPVRSRFDTCVQAHQQFTGATHEYQETKWTYVAEVEKPKIRHRPQIFHGHGHLTYKRHKSTDRTKADNINIETRNVNYLIWCKHKLGEFHVGHHDIIHIQTWTIKPDTLDIVVYKTRKLEIFVLQGGS